MKLNMLGIMKICRLLILGLVLTGLGLLTPGQAIAESTLLPRAYICNYYDDSVSVIDVATNSVIDTVYGFSGPWSVAVKPDGTEVYVANNNSSNTVSVINTATNTITANLTVGLNPQAMKMGTDGVNLYVVAGNNLYTIDTGTKEVSAPVDLGFIPYDFTMSGSKIYLSSEADNTVKVFDTINGYVDPPIAVGSSPQAITTSPDGSKVYVANSLSNDGINFISVIDTNTNEVIAVQVESILYGMLNGITVSPDGTLVYVSLAVPEAEGKVIVLDASNNTVITSRNVGSNPMGVGVSPDGQFVYVLNSGSNDVTVIDTSTNDYVTTTLGVGTSPGSQGNFIVNVPVQFEFSLPGFAVSEKGNYATVTVIRTKGSDITASVSYTTEDGTATAGSDYTATFGELIFEPGETFKTISIPISNDGIAEGSETVNLSLLNPTGGVALGSQNTAILTISESPFAYIANSGSNTVSVIDTSTNLVATTIKVGLGPEGVAASPDGTRIYITMGGSDNVSVLDGQNNTLIANVNVGEYPRGVVVSPDGSKVYVPNFYDGTVSVLDTETNTVVNTIVYDSVVMPYGIAISPDGTKLYLTDSEMSDLNVIDLSDNNTVTTYNVVGGLSGIAVSPDGAWVYVTNQYNTVTPISISTEGNIVQDPINVGLYPGGIAVSPDSKKVYVSNNGDNTVSVIDTSDNNSVTSVNVGFSPSGITVSPDGSKVYVVNSGDNSVTVVDALTNIITDTVYVGQNPISFGNFIGPSDITPPAINSTTPSDGSASVTLDSTINIVFNENITFTNPSNITLTSGGTGVSFGYIIVGNTLTINPIGGLTNGKEYTVTILFGAIRDLAGNVYGDTDSNFSFSFTSEPAPDTTPPGITSTTPSDGVVGVAVTPNRVDIIFDEPIIPGSVFNGINIMAGTTPVGYTSIIDGNLLSLTPSPVQAPNTTYTVTIPAGAVQDIAYNSLAATDSFWFTTVDTLAPTLISQNPSIVPITGQLSLTFSEDIAEGPNFSSISIKTGGSTIINYTYSISGATLTLNPPTVGLAYGTTYTLTIPTGSIHDLVGNTSVAEYTYTFTTVSAPVVDTTPPSDINPYLVSLPTGVIVNSPIVLEFGENITEGSAFSNITLMSGGSVVGCTYVISGPSLTITPLADLAHATTYTLTIPANGVRDAAYNNLVSPYTYTFKTNIFSNYYLEATISLALNRTEYTSSDLTNLTSLNLENYEITDLTGLELATNLQQLNLGHNYISDLRPLKELNNLTDLYLENNNITNVVYLQNLTKLQRLFLSNNNITDLEPLRYLNNLIVMVLGDNQITDLDPLVGITGLQELWLDHNEGILNLDKLSRLTNLRVLGLQSQYYGYKITDISALSELTKLQYIYLTDNLISNLSPLAKLTNLEGLYLGDNQITDLGPLVTNASKGGLGQGSYLYLQNNNLDLNTSSSASNLQTLKDYKVDVHTETNQIVYLPT